jgi:hypothetical protein
MKFILRVLAVSVVVWLAKTLAEGFRRGANPLHENDRIDEMSADSFPSSDPPSSWAGTTK